MTGRPTRGLSRAELAKRIDHTLLRPTATLSELDRLCDEAARYGLWSVCVGPTHVRHAADRLRGSGVRVCTVAGFPLGFSVARTKLTEARCAAEDGADEVDMVMNVAAFKSGDTESVAREVEEVSGYCAGARKLLKVIIECCYLTDEEKVKAGRLAEAAGADFVKTSTGFGSGGATVEDVALLKRALTKARVKASGGINTLEKAVQMIAAGADRVGTSSGAKIMEE